MNFNEDGPSYFCYVTLNDEPTKPFVKHSANHSVDPTFVINTSDHGYSYIKIIRLNETHPLVNYGQIS